MNGIHHAFDMSISSEGDFLIEEMAESKQFVSDCVGTAGTVSTAGTSCVPSTFACIACIGTVISCSTAIE